MTKDGHRKFWWIYFRSKTEILGEKIKWGKCLDCLTVNFQIQPIVYICNFPYFCRIDTFPSISEKFISPYFYISPIFVQFTCVCPNLLVFSLPPILTMMH